MSGADSMVTLQERLVNLINQLNMPIIETSLVVSRWIIDYYTIEAAF